jgi:general secretion pathway protein G
LSQISTRGFTLMEILIVVSILGIIAALVVPQFSNASSSARENVLKEELRHLRTTVIVFKAQHNDTPPGYPGGNISAAPTQEAFISQMTMYTDIACNTADAYSTTFRYGPYLSRMPVNPVNGLSTIMMIGNGQSLPETPDGSTGWIYKAQTQEIVANLPGRDSNGILYSEY